MTKKDLWFSLDGHRAGRLFQEGVEGRGKEKLLAAPMFEIANTGSSAFGPHKGLRPKLMEVSGGVCGRGGKERKEKEIVCSLL